MASLGRTFRRLRLARGLTQQQVASPRYTHAYVSTIEAGRRNPSPQALRYFANKLGVDVEELVTGRPPELTEELKNELLQARLAASDGRFAEADAAAAAVARRAKRYKAPRLEARAHEIRALVLERSGKPEEALALYERSERVLAWEPASARADAVAGKARCLQALGDLRYAIFLLESLDGLTRLEDSPDPSALAQIRACLLDAYLEAGLPDKAAEAANELVRIGRRLRDPVREGQMHLYLARLELAKGRAREADRLLARAAEAYRASGLRTEAGYTHLARGYLLSREGKLTAAGRELEAARRIFEETIDGKDLNRTLNELGRVERLRGNAEAAISVLNTSISSLGDADTPILAWAHRELGLVHATTDHASAEKHLRTAVELFDRAEQPVEVAITYRMLGDVLKDGGRPDAAFEAYRTGMHALPEST